MTKRSWVGTPAPYFWIEVSDLLAIKKKQILKQIRFQVCFRMIGSGMFPVMVAST
jgi:hypothetical protein